MKTILFILILILSYPICAQEDEMMVTKTFIVLRSTRKYGQALREAQRLANKLQIPMDLRSLSADKELGLNSQQICGCGEQHGYIPRGRSDDGAYISIEYSTGYAETQHENKYLLVAFSGDLENAEVQFERITKIYRNAELRPFQIYVGCMH